MRNSEHYNDPTASEALSTVIYEERIQAKQKELIRNIISMCNLAGFNLKNKVELEHRKTGKIFK